MSFSSPVERYLFSDRLRKPNLSRSFIEFIKKLVVAKDEFNVISAELHSINERLSNPNIGKNELRYVLITMIYFEILGHSAESCGYMSALMLCQKSDSIQDKRLAYLALTLFLHPQHELTIMLVNTITKDLSTDDEATISCGLLLASHLLNPQTIPIILPKIESLLQHRK
ncbi:hypothetical protein BKA69DRAFT_624389 [Paraphysoderma sedebokerense]|nr:hypothetical protein BKA69DRAFT_624389 [Paraphysoderma sedebokerense]